MVEKWEETVGNFCIRNYSKIYDRQKAKRNVASHYKNTTRSAFTETQCFNAPFLLSLSATSGVHAGKFITNSTEEKLSVLKMKIYMPSFSFKCGYICLFWHGNPFLRWSTKIGRRPPGMSLTLRHWRQSAIFASKFVYHEFKNKIFNKFIRFHVHKSTFCCVEKWVSCMASFLKLHHIFCAINCHWGEMREREGETTKKSAKNLVTEVLLFIHFFFLCSSLKWGCHSVMQRGLKNVKLMTLFWNFFPPLRKFFLNPGLTLNPDDAE